MAVHETLAASDAAAEWSTEDAQRWWTSFRPDGPVTTGGQTEIETIAVDLAAR